MVRVSKFSKSPIFVAAAFLVCEMLLTGCSDGRTNAVPTGVSSSQAMQLSASVKALVEAGIAQARQGNLADAKRTFESVLLVEKANEFAYFNLGVVASMQNDSALALKEYNLAIQSDAQYTPALYNKAVIVEATDKAQAMLIYESIVQINPKASTSYLRLSFLYSAAGQTDKAAAARATALKLDPALASAANPDSK